MIYMNITKS